MNLPVASQGSKGFTLVELLLALALMFIVAVFMFPVGLSFYQAQLFRETSDGILNNLRKAQNLSVTGKHDSGYGIKILDGSYVHFAGTSYNTRNTAHDEVYAFPESINVTGLTEIVFEETNGIPSATGTIDIVMGARSDRISIESSGYITR